jgi:phospholipid/cholesterol/gamma-HCH transport system permease protein
MHTIFKHPGRYLLSKQTDLFFTEVSGIFKFAVRFFKEGFVPPYEFKELVRQCYNVGYKSLALISLTGFITGLVFTKQSRPSLSEFGATSWLPSLVAIAVIRALAPLITALICSGKVGSNIGAELGSMKVFSCHTGACHFTYDAYTNDVYGFCSINGFLYRCTPE